jgi:nucleoid-associated protein YgaU
MRVPRSGNDPDQINALLSAWSISHQVTDAIVNAVCRRPPSNAQSAQNQNATTRSSNGSIGNGIIGNGNGIIGNGNGISSNGRINSSNGSMSINACAAEAAKTAAAAEAERIAAEASSAAEAELIAAAAAEAKRIAAIAAEAERIAAEEAADIVAVEPARAAVDAGDKIGCVGFGGLGVKTAALDMLVPTCALHIKSSKDMR